MYVGTELPVVDTTRLVSERTYAGSRAYDAVGSCSGSAGPTSWPDEEGEGSGWTLMRGA